MIEICMVQQQYTHHNIWNGWMELISRLHHTCNSNKQFQRLFPSAIFRFVCFRRWLHNQQRILPANRRNQSKLNKNYTLSPIYSILDMDIASLGHLFDNLVAHLRDRQLSCFNINFKLFIVSIKPHTTFTTP